MFHLKIAEEGMVEIEACEIPCILFDGECNSLQDNDVCHYLCRINELLLGGSCKNYKCICYANWTSPLWE